MYVDGFLLAVPNDRKEEYRLHAEKSAVMLKEHGMVSMVECWGDDVPEGKLTSFRMAVKQEENETVVFSWMTWPSKEARDEGWKKIMEDPRMKMDAESMPFDGKRMIYGGFNVLVNV
jgi:uncharacterized protein YbaA (DUF1428 family)